MLPGSETESKNPGGPQADPVTGAQPGKGRKPEPVAFKADGTPSRALRRHLNRLARQQAEVAALAEAAIPEPFRKPGGPRDGPVTGTLPTGEEIRLRMQESRADLVGTGQLPRGRPSEYTEEEGDRLCAWVQAGGSLRAYTKQTGRKAETVYRWMREDAGFQARYSQAHEDRSDTLTDEMLEIADDAAGHWQTDSDGKQEWVPASIEGVAAAKLRVEARKWIASKLRPQKWGDKVIQEHKGAVSIRIGVTAAQAQAPLQVVEEVARSLPSVPGMRLSVGTKA